MLLLNSLLPATTNRPVLYNLAHVFVFLVPHINYIPIDIGHVSPSFLVAFGSLYLGHLKLCASLYISFASDNAPIKPV
jgi:hypothetical protein